MVENIKIIFGRRERRREKMSRRLEDLVEIANPQQPHCPVVLLLDISGSMGGDPVKALNDGVRVCKEEVEKDDLAAKRVDLAIITFGGTTHVVQDFTSIDDFEPSAFSAGGGTPMGEAIKMGADLIELRKQQYKEQGIDYFRPWLFMITDGAPTDMRPGDATWDQVVNIVHGGENDKKFMFFAVAVEQADMEILSQITPPNRQPVRLKGLAFSELFSWLSKSMSAVSASSPGEQVALENPVSAGWGEISI